MDKPSWPEYFMAFARVASLRSPDPIMKVGAVLVQDNRIISTGYNGLKAGTSENIDWEDRELVRKRIIHAEMNCIIYARSKFKDACLYVTHSPCSECLKLLFASGVSAVVFENKYKDFEAVHELAKELNVQMWSSKYLKFRTLEELLQ